MLNLLWNPLKRTMALPFGLSSTTSACSHYGHRVGKGIRGTEGESRETSTHIVVSSIAIDLRRGQSCFARQI